MVRPAPVPGNGYALDKCEGDRILARPHGSEVYAALFLRGSG